jgi:hypothetical protein
VGHDQLTWSRSQRKLRPENKHLTFLKYKQFALNFDRLGSDITYYSTHTMANTIITKTLPRFLLPQLSWQTTPVSIQAIRAFSTSQVGPKSSSNQSPSSGKRPSIPRRQHASPERSILSSLAYRQAFHATARRQRDHHFDTLKFVQRLREEGFTEAQSVAMMKVLSDVIEERYLPYFPSKPFLMNPSIQNLTRTMVLREDQAKATYTQKVDFAKLRSELLSADSTESSTTRASHERLTNDLAKLNSRLRDEVSRTQASVRLDLNLEKGRIREEANVQELKIKETETKIEQEVAGLREKLEAVKFQTLQWLMGVCTGKYYPLYPKVNLTDLNRYCCFDSWCLEIADVDVDLLMIL